MESDNQPLPPPIRLHRGRYRPRLSPAEIAAIQADIDAGQLTQRKIASKNKTSRNVVQRIANGTYLPGVATTAGDWQPVSKQPQRCPECGGMVLMPCVQCGMEERRKLRKIQTLEAKATP